MCWAASTRSKMPPPSSRSSPGSTMFPGRSSPSTRVSIGGRDNRLCPRQRLGADDTAFGGFEKTYQIFHIGVRGVLGSFNFFNRLGEIEGLVGKAAIGAAER